MHVGLTDPITNNQYYYLVVTATKISWRQ